MNYMNYALIFKERTSGAAFVAGALLASIGFGK